jgi:anthranilate phosphoribosyltransferase
MIDAIVQLVEAGRNLSMEQMESAIGEMIEGRCTETEMARLLTALHRKGETVEEIAGAAAALRRHVTPIRTRHTVFLDTCGTGGDGSRTFNISTAAAIVTAAAGVPVAKHGNRGMTSRSGSADALVALGVHVEAEVACVESCLDELGLCFCFAPLLHQAMKHVAPVRKKLGTPTIFNLLGPLTNPAGAPYQLLGVGRAELQLRLAEALVLLGTTRTLVVHAADGLDEVSLAGPTEVIEAVGGRLRRFTWTPDDFGLRESSRETLLVENPAESAAVIRSVLAGRPGPARDITLANAAAALWCSRHTPCAVGGGTTTLQEAVQLAARAVDSGKAALLLERLAAKTHQAGTGIGSDRKSSS